MLINDLNKLKANQLNLYKLANTKNIIKKAVIL